MLNENAQKWVHALESGHYQQGRGALCGNGKFCCLGVACEVAEQNGVELQVTLQHNLELDESYIAYNNHAISLPEPVHQWLGLKSSSGEYDSCSSSLAWLNDSGKSFKEIAEIIKSEPEGLFAK